MSEALAEWECQRAPHGGRWRFAGGAVQSAGPQDRTTSQLNDVNTLCQSLAYYRRLGLKGTFESRTQKSSFQKKWGAKRERAQKTPPALADRQRLSLTRQHQPCEGGNDPRSSLRLAPRHCQRGEPQIQGASRTSWPKPPYVKSSSSSTMSSAEILIRSNAASARCKSSRAARSVVLCSTAESLPSRSAAARLIAP